MTPPPSQEPENKRLWDIDLLKSNLWVINLRLRLQGLHSGFKKCVTLDSPASSFLFPFNVSGSPSGQCIRSRFTPGFPLRGFKDGHYPRSAPVRNPFGVSRRFKKVGTSYIWDLAQKKSVHRTHNVPAQAVHPMYQSSDRSKGFPLETQSVQAGALKKFAHRTLSNLNIEAA